MDGSKVQIDFTLISSCLCLDVPCAWNDNKVSSWVGSSMCSLQTRISKSAAVLATSRTQLLQTLATLENRQFFHARVRRTLQGLTVLEKCWQDAATIGGSCKRPSVWFKPSMCLTQLRLQRRTCQEAYEHKRLSFQIRRQQRLEVRQGKSQTLDRILRTPMGWRHLHAVKAVFGRKTQQHPQLEEFANLLEDLFAGSPAEPMPVPVQTEQPISAEEFSETIR